MKAPFRLAAVVGSLLLVSLVSLVALGAPSPEPADGVRVWRVYYGDPDRIPLLNAFDLWEFRDADEGYVLVAGDEDDRRRLENLGFVVAEDPRRTADLYPEREAQRGGGIPGFPCYRTVEETFATAEQIVADYPDLASWVDIGDSWQKQQGLGGYDLRALRLTQSAVPGPKPKLIGTFSIHAREYAPAELATRFAERLVGGYGTDADITWILDHHEVHLVLQANPDGRKQAEGGLSWRKNTNTNYCSPTSDLRGADLNRNFEFEWGCCNGSAGAECDILYRGPSPASEPETQAYQAYLRAQFPDRRDDPLGAAAPADTQGVYVDVHAFSELVLWPWGFGGNSPNVDGLTTLGRRLAWFNGYEPKQAIELYPTDGTTVDFSYGDLGVASYVYELGTAFFQDCATFENVILPDNSDSLLYAARVARAPYVEPAGPDTLSLAVSPFLVEAGTPVEVTGVVDDTRFENRNGVEPTQTVVGGEVRIDTPHWLDPDGPDAALAPADGAFDATVEAVTTPIDTTGLAGGRHVVYVRGQDASGALGPVSARFFWVADGTEGTVGGTVVAEEGGAPIAATLSVEGLGVAGTSAAADGTFSLLLPAGTWTLRAVADGFSPVEQQVVVAEQGATTADFVLPTRPDVLLVDDDDDAPNVGPSYLAALDTLGIRYDVWNTRERGGDPDAEAIDAVNTIVWFTGGERGGGAGPTVETEARLADWLDRSGCLLISSQDYLFDRGLTPFMLGYLGVGSANETFIQFGVSGVNVFAGLGSYFLNLPYTNHVDTISAGNGGLLAFVSGSSGTGTSLDTSVHRAAWLGFGIEGISQAAGREEVLGRFFDWCEPLPGLDPDADGVPNADDCAPADGTASAIPGAAASLAIVAGDPDRLEWVAPAQTGGGATVYDVLTASTATGFASATCEADGLAVTTFDSGSVPAAGEVAFFLVRARNACGGNLGVRSDGSERVGAICP